MAAGEMYKADDIKEVTFRITLNDIRNFKKFVSKEFYVRGNPWVVQFERIEAVDKSTSLSVFLFSKVTEKSENWAIIAQFSATLVSSNYDDEPRKKQIAPCAFHSESLNWGTPSGFLWDKLIDPKKGFIKEDKLKIDINVKASPMQDTSKEDLMKFEHLRRCCDDFPTGKFRITAKFEDEFLGVCSPVFILGGLLWRIVVSKAVKNGNEYLRIGADNFSVAKNCSFQMKTSSQLISSDPSVDPVKMETNMAHEVKRNLRQQCILRDLARWNEVFSRGNKFIQNGSFIIEIQMEIEKVEGQEAGTQPMCGRCKNAVELKCSICFESLVDRDISSTYCGHIFCTACIESALQKREFCPSCNQAATPTKIHKVFLPK